MDKVPEKPPMNKVLKWGLAAGGTLAGFAGLGVAYLLVAFPKAGPVPELRAERTPENVARGAYLAEHVTVCLDCHSERDWSRFSGPPKAGTAGKGGEHFTHDMGFPGDFYARNITPAAIGSWSDGDLAHVITTGVSKDGRAIFPVMPYPDYAHLCARDVSAIVAFIRTLAPIAHDVPESKLDFPMNLIVRTIPNPPSPWSCETGSPSYGTYLTTIAGCKECHTQQDHGKALPGMDFAGGFQFPLPGGGHVVSANLTPDKDTGLGNWTKEEFITKFKAFGVPGAATPVNQGAANTIMPWTMYAGMTPEDLGAIYDYLRTQRPVSNRVDRFKP